MLCPQNCAPGNVRILDGGPCCPNRTPRNVRVLGCQCSGCTGQFGPCPPCPTPPGDAVIYFWPPDPVVLPPEPVNPPEAYVVPGGGTLVTTTAELLTAWGSGVPLDIVLADGVYDNAGPLPNSIVPHRLWAQNLLGAELLFGLSWGGNSGGSAGELHGIAFNVDSLAKVSALGLLNEAIVLTWGAIGGGFAGNLIVEDCTFNMNNVVGSAIQATYPFGLQVRRVQIQNGIDWGIFAFRNGVAGDALPTAMILEDIDIDHIRYPVTSLSMGGIGVWAGHECVITRCKVRDVDWAGVALVNDATHCRLYDIDCDNCQQGYLDPGGRGVYFEHCHDVIIDRVHVGPESMFGISWEWNSGSTNPCLNDWVPRNYDIWVSNAFMQSYKVGIAWDITVQRCSIRNARFERSWLGAINDFNSFSSPPYGCTIQTTNVNDMVSIMFRLSSLVPAIYRQHHGTYLLPPPPGWPATPAGYNDSALNVHDRRYVEAYSPQGSGP